MVSRARRVSSVSYSADLRLMTSPKVAPPEPPATPPRRPRAERPSAKRGDRSTMDEPATPTRTVELKSELKAISLILFGLFLAAALVAVGVATARSGFDATGTVGFIGRVLVEPLVWLFGWPSA